MGSTKFSTTTALALAAVVLSSSTTLFAVAKIPKHSVGAKQLKTSAVTNKKVAKGAITASKVASNALTGTQIKESSLGKVPSSTNSGFALTAGNSSRLENKGAADFVGAPRIAFGKGNSRDVPATTMLTLPNLGVTVSTDGDATPGTDTDVTVTLPLTTAFSWIVGVEGQAVFSTMGGPTTLSATGTTNGLTAHIWRFDNGQAMYLHCAFDRSGFTTSHPLSCLAMST